jgi:hypothetical protein
MMRVIARRSTLRLAGLLCLVVAACQSDRGTGPNAVDSDPNTAPFVTSDIANFWEAYDAGGKDGTAEPIQRLYLDRASTGLKDFIRLRSLTAANLAQMLRSYPRYFASIKANSLSLSSAQGVLSRIRQGYTNITSLYPPAVFTPMTFLVGRFSTGGTTSENGILIGTEFYSLGPTTPTDELGQFQKDNVKSIDTLPFIVAHEHAHILQGHAAALMKKSQKTLLDQSLIEGSADFVGELASGGTVNAWLRTFALPREHDLWIEFKAAMHGTDISHWLYNQGSATADRPGDLGYFIGYRIAEAYYNKTADKMAALKAIIEVRDADVFLQQSGYNP